MERGHLAIVGLPALRQVVAALDARLDLVLRWNGGDLDRLLNWRHAALHESIAGLFSSLDGWTIQPEVSFSVYGERGVIDVLAWNATRGVLLVIELKTEIVDVNDLMGTVDRKRRLAQRIAADRGWNARSVSVWVIVEEGRTNRRRVSEHARVLRAAFPNDGRTMRRWLRDPSEVVAALSFLPIRRAVTLRTRPSARHRVRVPDVNQKDAVRARTQRPRRQCAVDTGAHAPGEAG